MVFTPFTPWWCLEVSPSELFRMMPWGIIWSPPDRHNGNGDIASSIPKLPYRLRYMITGLLTIVPFYAFKWWLWSCNFYVSMFMLKRIGILFCQINSGMQGWGLNLFRCERVRLQSIPTLVHIGSDTPRTSTTPTVVVEKWCIMGLTTHIGGFWSAETYIFRSLWMLRTTLSVLPLSTPYPRGSTSCMNVSCLLGDRGAWFSL